jgi:hypothetical protein
VIRCRVLRRITSSYEQPDLSSVPTPEPRPSTRTHTPGEEYCCSRCWTKGRSWVMGRGASDPDSLVHIDRSNNCGTARAFETLSYARPGRQGSAHAGDRTTTAACQAPLRKEGDERAAPVKRTTSTGWPGSMSEVRASASFGASSPLHSSVETNLMMMGMQGQPRDKWRAVCLLRSACRAGVVDPGRRTRRVRRCTRHVQCLACRHLPPPSGINAVRPSACALAASASFFCYSYVQVALKVQVVIAAVDACMVCSELRASWPWGIADLGRPEQGRRLVVTVRCGRPRAVPSLSAPPGIFTGETATVSQATTASVALTFPRFLCCPPMVHIALTAGKTGRRS